MCVRLGVLDLWLLAIRRCFSDSDVVVVLGWDSVVIESWSSCFLGVVVVIYVGQGTDFGELVLTESVLPGDPYWVIRQWCFRMQPAFDHLALSFTTVSAMKARQELELGVDSAF